MDPGASLAPKMIQKLIKKCTWSNPKNLVFVWRVLQKWGSGTFLWHPKCLQKIIRNFVKISMVFGRLLVSILASKIIQKCIQNQIENSSIFWLIFAPILDGFWRPKWLQNVIKNLVDFWMNFGIIFEPKMEPKWTPRVPQREVKVLTFRKHFATLPRGPLQGGQMDPKGRQKGAKMDLKGSQNGPKWS